MEEENVKHVQMHMEMQKRLEESYAKAWSDLFFKFRTHNLNEEFTPLVSMGYMEEIMPGTFDRYLESQKDHCDECGKEY